MASGAESIPDTLSSSPLTKTKHNIYTNLSTIFTRSQCELLSQRLSFSSSCLKTPDLVRQPLSHCSVFMLPSWQLIPAVSTQKNDCWTPWFLLHYTRCSLKGEGCYRGHRSVTSQERLLSTPRQIYETRSHQGN